MEPNNSPVRLAFFLPLLLEVWQFQALGFKTMLEAAQWVPAKIRWKPSLTPEVLLPPPSLQPSDFHCS